MAGKKQPIRYAVCHPERVYFSKGFCRQCYNFKYNRDARSLKPLCHPDRPLVARGRCVDCYVPPVKVTCHPGRRHAAKGLCDSCYIALRRKENSVNAKCHPTKPHIAKGLCWTCYTRQRRFEKYGLAEGQFDELMILQESKCGICARNLSGSSLDDIAVDHDHQTNEVRGLLCHRCNMAIGGLGDTVAALQMALKYLLNPPSSALKNNHNKCKRC